MNNRSTDSTLTIPRPLGAKHTHNLFVFIGVLRFVCFRLESIEITPEKPMS